MSTNDRTTDGASERDDQKQEQEKIEDLPFQQPTEQDAEQLKGGATKRGTQDDSI